MRQHVLTLTMCPRCAQLEFLMLPTCLAPNSHHFQFARTHKLQFIAKSICRNPCPNYAFNSRLAHEHGAGAGGAALSPELTWVIFNVTGGITWQRACTQRLHYMQTCAFTHTLTRTHTSGRAIILAPSTLVKLAD